MRAKTIVAVWDASPCPMLLVAPNLIIEGANKRCAEALFAPPEEIIGKHIFDVLRNNASLPRTRSIEVLRSSFNKVVARQEPDVVLSVRYDVRNREGIFVERHWNLSNYPVLDPSTGLLKHFMLTAVEAEGRLAQKGASIGRKLNQHCVRSKPGRHYSRVFGGFSNSAFAECGTAGEAGKTCGPHRRRQATESADGPFASLTKREKEILSMTMEGHVTKTVAWKLGISVRTVETHRTKILRKLSARNFLEVSRYFREHNDLDRLARL